MQYRERSDRMVHLWDGLKPDDGFVRAASGRCARGNVLIGRTVLIGHRLNHD